MLQEHHLKLLRQQLIAELTEAEVYHRLSELSCDDKNRKVLDSISRDEKRHAQMIAEVLGEKGRANQRKVSSVLLNARVLGLTFALKFMERGEVTAGHTYQEIMESYPQLAQIAEDEGEHEKALIDLLDDERLNHMGAIVLGLNDALVELTGALAGFTLSLSDPMRIAKTGLITGLAAAMSMAASAFLSARADAQAKSEGDVSAGKTALYTGVAYVITVILLISPYFLWTNVTGALVTMLLIAFGIIAFFNFYLSIARETSFKRGFLEMAGISTVVALISYGIGYLLQ